MRRRKVAAKAKAGKDEEPAELPPPAPLRTTTRGAGSQWTDEDDEEQASFLLALRIRGASRKQMSDAARARFNIGHDRAMRLLERALERLDVDHSKSRPYAKAEASARIRAHLADLNAPGKDGDGNVRPKQYSALARFEHMLAEVEGAFEPVQVRVEHVHQLAAIQVISSLTQEQMHELQERARERKRLAELARTIELPTLPSKANGAAH